MRKRIVPLDAAPEQGACDAGNNPLRDALKVLEPELRLPVLLHYMEGYKIREISSILNLPDGTVKTRLARAKQKLRELMEEEEA